ncbi:MAG TPA: hypothetical protein VFX78_06410 [Candidatus Eisenbacteria bacterium]|nr:hypothetical protein [Candidatus Eisenbacteria bacterium]
MRPNAVAWLLAVSVVAITAGSAFAQTDTTRTAPLPPPPPVTGTEPDFPRGRISGLVFGDLYYNLAGDPAHHYNAAGADSGKNYIDGSPLSAPTPITKDLNGAQLRRVYFQLDNDLSIKYSTRFRLEADSKELTSGGKIGIFVKAAYLQAKDWIPRGNAFLGMTNTPTFENSEEFWGYRPIEKTIVDFRGLSSASDLGVSLKGFLDGGHKIGYSGMVGTDTGQRPENNRQKRAYLSIPLRPIEDLRIEPYVDYEWIRTSGTVPGEHDRALYKLFAGYELKRMAIGGEAFKQVVHGTATSSVNTYPVGYSVFARFAGTAKLHAYARYDKFQPDTKGANRVDQSLYIAGFDWEPYKDVHFMPNIESLQYDARGTAVPPGHHDTQARITFYYRFSKP